MLVEYLIYYKCQDVYSFRSVCLNSTGTTFSLLTISTLTRTSVRLRFPLLKIWCRVIPWVGKTRSYFSLIEVIHPSPSNLRCTPSSPFRPCYINDWTSTTSETHSYFDDRPRLRRSTGLIRPITDLTTIFTPVRSPTRRRTWEPSK